MARLRDVVVLSNARIVVVVERNYGGSVLSSRVAGICARFEPICAMTQDTSARLRRIGVMLDEEIKEKMRNSLAIMLRANVIHLSTPFVSSLDGDVARNEVVGQLRNYRFEDVAPKKGSFRPAKRMLTGKSAGHNDDLAICVQMCCFWPGTHQAGGERCLVDCSA